MDITEKFLKDYDFLLPHIKNIIKKYSGTHGINEKKAKQWIDSQPNQSSKRAAQIIIDHTEYITLEDTETLAEHLITKYYKEIIENHPEQTIYFVAGDNKKSNYWLSIIALSYIKRYNLREPDYYYYMMNPTLMEDPNNVFIYFDDMAYSGGQTYSFIEKYVNEKLRKEIDLHLGSYSFEYNKQEIRNQIAALENQMTVFEEQELKKYKTRKENFETQIKEKEANKKIKVGFLSLFDDYKIEKIKDQIETINEDKSWVLNSIERKKKEIAILQKDLLFIDNKTYAELYKSKFNGINRLTKSFLTSGTKESYNTVQQFLDNMKFPNLYYLLIGINKNAYDKISVVHYNHSYGQETYIVKPFKIFYGQMFTTIDQLVESGTITEKDLFYMSYYFSQGLTPNILLYFDHKIADEPSTFLRLYNYGYVVPTNFDIANYYPRYESYLDSRSRNNKLSYVQTQFYKLYKKYYNTRELPIGQQDITEPIQFIPFINNCFDVQKIIQNPLLRYINYFIFTSDTNVNLIPGIVKKSENEGDFLSSVLKKEEKKAINPEHLKYVDIIENIEISKNEYYNDKFENIYYSILKMFWLYNENIYKTVSINRMMIDRPKEYDEINPDPDLYNLSLIQKFMDVCDFILFIRTHRCDLSFYKSKIEEYAPKLDTEEDILENEVPMPWPWEDPFKYWRKGMTKDDGKGMTKGSNGGKGMTKRKKQNKRRKTYKYKKSRK